jgi:hypothetical protein
MLKSSEPDSVINNIVEEVQKLTPVEQQALLARIRLSNYLKRNNIPVANYNINQQKPPDLKEIDKWKHESRAKNEGK